MKCSKCQFENVNPAKEGKDRNGIQKYRCQNKICGKIFLDPIEYEEWDKNLRKRAKSEHASKNALDEAVTYLLYFKILNAKKFGAIIHDKAKKGIKITISEIINDPKFVGDSIGGIGSHESIAAILDCPKSTITYWIKKYADPSTPPPKIVPEDNIMEYIKSKTFGEGLLPLLSLGLDYGISPEIDEIKKQREQAVDSHTTYIALERIKKEREQRSARRPIEAPEKIPYEHKPLNEAEVNWYNDMVKRENCRNSKPKKRYF